MSHKPFPLTPDQAISMLSDGETIHTFRSSPGILVGADWDREELIDAIRSSECEIGGSMCQQMNHGLVIHAGSGPLFVECREGIDYDEFEASLKAVSE